MEGYNGNDNQLDVRIRSDHGGGFKVTSGFCWCPSYYNYEEITTDELLVAELFGPIRSACPETHADGIQKSPGGTAQKAASENRQKNNQENTL
jgi:hypothetical protein